MKNSIIILVILSLCFLTTGCFSDKKEVKSAKEFISIAKDLKFVTKDVTSEQNDKQKKMLKSVNIAAKENFQIEFYVFKTEEIAKTAFFNGERLFDTKKANDYANNIEHGDNYGYFYVDIPKRYGVVSRVENTLILVDTTRKNKKEVKQFIEEMGY